MEISAKCHPLVFNERRGNPHTTWQDAAGPKTLLYTGTTAWNDAFNLKLNEHFMYIKFQIAENTLQKNAVENF